MDDVRHLAAFVAVAEHLHIGRAAVRLGVPRTTLSARLRRLEDCLGVRLVNRRHRCRIALTPEGAAVVQAARAVVDANEALLAMADDVRRGRRGVVRVALVTAPFDRAPADDASPDVTTSSLADAPAEKVPRGRDDHLDAVVDDEAAGVGVGRGVGVGVGVDVDVDVDVGRSVGVGRGVGRGRDVGVADAAGDENGVRGERSTTAAVGGSEGDWSDLGRFGEEIARALGGDEGWTVEFVRMDRWSARRAMAVGGLECAIGTGAPLRLGPGALDRRPHRIERARSIRVGRGRGVGTSVTWRAAWATRPTHAAWGAARIRDRLVGTAERLRRADLDVRFPEAAARREAAAARRSDVRARREQITAETRRYGADVAVSRARREEERRVIERFEAATRGGEEVGIHLAVAWMCAVKKVGGDQAGAGPRPSGGPRDAPARPPRDPFGTGRGSGGGPPDAAPPVP